MKDLRILITAAGSPSIPGLAKCLKNNGERDVYLVGTDMKADATIWQMMDKVCLVPGASDPKYVDALLKVCIDEKIDVLIPGISQELEALQARRAEFEAVGTKVSVSTGEGLEIANDKIKLYDYMKEHGFNTPGYRIVSDIESFKKACEELGYPNKGVCVKLSNASGSRGVRIINPNQSRYDIFVNEKPNSFFTSMDDMLSMFSEVEELPEMMVMEYLPGMEYSVDLLADKGEVKYIVGRESNIILASIPQMATIAKNDEAYEISTKIVGMLKLDGNVDLDFKFDENGHPKLMEINPRLAATLSPIKAAGVNLLYLRVKQLLGEELPECEVNYGVVMKRRYHELFVDKDGNPIEL